MARYEVTIISPFRYVNAAAFTEVGQTLRAGLEELGYDAVLTANGSHGAGRRQIVLGANLLPHCPIQLQPGAVLYNLEQVGERWVGPEILNLYRRFEVWDYSPRNIAALADEGISARLLPIGYYPGLTRIARSPAPDIDVLFYGSQNPRRAAVLDECKRLGLKVWAPYGVFGAVRDALIARARLVINIHFYEAKVLEMVRLSYLLANGCTVLSEPSADPREDVALLGGVAFAPYEQLATRAFELLNDDQERERLAKRGLEIMRARPISRYLAQVLGA